MREHLFRIKDHGEWYYGFPMAKRIVTDDKYVGFIGCDANGQSYYNAIADAYTLSEFTGLYDRNGKRIFEGDIITYEDGDPSDYEYHDGTIMNTGEIIFCDGKFCFTNAVSVTMDDLLCDNNMLDCEVIGNKWDNPDLLEVRDDK